MVGSSQLARIFYEQSVLPLVAYREKIDCIHWFANTCSLASLVPSVVTIHDLMFLDNQVDRPSEVSSAKKLYLREMERYTCRHAEVIAPVSEATAEVAVRLFGVERKRIVVVPNPLDEAFCAALPEEVKTFRGRWKLPSQFWLYVAHPYPHKNHARLIAAYKKFRDVSQCTWPLVLRGDNVKGNEMLAQVALDLGIAESIVWLPRLSSEDMVRLYSAATALVFPSLYEGCGIPVLEAMACGCPVTASDINTTKEFGGDATPMFDATSVDAIAGAMRQFFEDPALRESCSTKGLIKAEQYSSKTIAGRLLTAYRHSVPKQIVNVERGARN
jgi:glycosyltransferase involved in cell wall biosynthesis